MKNLTNLELQELCIKEKWFTCGSNGQYNKLFERNKQGASTEELSIIIWLCSDNIPRTEIYEKIHTERLNKTLI